MFDLYGYDSQSAAQKEARRKLSRQKWQRRANILREVSTAALLLAVALFCLWLAGLLLMDIIPGMQTGTVLQR